MSDSAKRFAVYSLGEALAGYNPVEVAQHIAKNTSRTPEAIQARLLSGRAQRIKSFSTFSSAEQVCERLRSVGLDAVIRELEADTEHSQHASFIEPQTDAPIIESDESDTGPNNERIHSDDSSGSDLLSSPISDASLSMGATLQRARRARLMTGLGVVALAFIMVAGLAYWWLFPSVTPSERAAERAMFVGQRPALVAAANIQQIRKLVSISGGQQDDLSFSKVFPTGSLLRQIIDSSQLGLHIDHVVIRLAVPAKGGATDDVEANSIFTGVFTEQSLLAELKPFFQIESMAAATYQLTPTHELFEGEICPIESDDNRLLSSRFLQFKDDHLLVANSRQALSSLSVALDSPSADSELAFAEWQSYRGNALVAAQVVDVSTMPGGLVVQSLVDTLGDQSKIGRLGMRIEPAPLARGVNVSLDVVAQKESLLSLTANEIRQWLDSTMNEYQSSNPALVKMLSRVKVSDATGLQIDFSLDSGLLNEANTLASEITAVMFGGGSLTMGSSSQEQVLSEVWDFTHNSAFVTESAYQIGSFDKFRPSYESGSHALFIGAVGQKPINSFSADAWSEGLAMQLELVAKRAVPDAVSKPLFPGDIADSGINYSLMLNEVLDKQGRSILLDERCVRQPLHGGRNHEPATNTQLQSGAFEVRKPVRLVSSAGITDIGRIQGVVEFTVPTVVKSKTLSMQTEQVLELPQATFKLAGIESGSVQYSISGDESVVTAVRAKNAAGAMLRSQGTMSFDNNVAKSFAGVVDSIEVYYVTAASTQTHRFDFSYQDPQKVSSETNRYAPDNLPAMALFDESDADKLSRRLDINELSQADRETVEQQFLWDKLTLDGAGENGVGVVETDSAVIYFAHDASATWNKTLSGKVILPHVKSVAANPRTVFVDLQLNGVAINNVPVSFSRLTLNGEAQPSLPLQVGAYDLGSFQVELPDEVTQLERVSGQLRFNIPTAMAQRPIIFSQGQAPSGVLTLLGFDYGWNAKTRYKLTRPVAGLTAAYLEFSNGAIEAANILEVNRDILEFSEIGEPRKITVIAVESTRAISQAFTLTPGPVR